MKDVKQAVKEQLRPILGKYGVEFEEEVKPQKKTGKTPVKKQ